jgi:hypothetical protein
MKATKMRRASVFLVCSMVVGVLAGCAQHPSDHVPWFSTPIAWGDAYRKADGKSAPFTPVAATVRLDSGGKAELADFATGRTVSGKDGRKCLMVEAQDSYSGPATWSSRNAYSVVLKFAGSAVEVQSGTSGFGDQDWSGLTILECASGATWGFTVQCGNPGYGGPASDQGPDRNKGCPAALPRLPQIAASPPT